MAGDFLRAANFRLRGAHLSALWTKVFKDSIKDGRRWPQKNLKRNQRTFPAFDFICVNLRNLRIKSL
jgi:hypothetical protein